MENFVDQTGAPLGDIATPTGLGRLDLKPGRLVCALPLPGVVVTRALAVEKTLNLIGDHSVAVASPQVFVHRVVWASPD